VIHLAALASSRGAKVRNRLRRLRDDDGATAVEYSLLAVAIAAVIVIIVFALGSQVKAMFNKTCDSISSNASLTETSSCS
jgi:pilus assembly protein Flp/PilA